VLRPQRDTVNCFWKWFCVMLSIKLGRTTLIHQFICKKVSPLSLSLVLWQNYKACCWLKRTSDGVNWLTALHFWMAKGPWNSVISKSCIWGQVVGKHQSFLRKQIQLQIMGIMKLGKIMVIIKSRNTCRNLYFYLARSNELFSQFPLFSKLRHISVSDTI